MNILNILIFNVCLSLLNYIMDDINKIKLNYELETRLQFQNLSGTNNLFKR